MESVGIDLVEVERIRRVVERRGDRFIKKVFTDQEWAYCRRKKNCCLSLAARFAAKEAVFKALGTGWGEGVKWRDVEVVNDGRGKPEIVLYGRAKELVGGRAVLVSLTHTREYAAAAAVLLAASSET